MSTGAPAPLPQSEPQHRSLSRGASDWVANLGEVVISWVAALGDVTLFSWNTMRWMFTRWPRKDTLFPNSGRSYFYKCEVWGHVDFIFGAGQAVFDDCDIVSRDRGSKTNNGYITAPSTEGDQPYGFLFVHSRLKKEHASMAPNFSAMPQPLFCVLKCPATWHGPPVDM